MSERRFRFGVITSVIWLVVMSCIYWYSKPTDTPLKPNEWGDFFAGAFAPLAFLWLVLGYLQQGEELKTSTKALQLQAEELKNSVEQQRALVEVSREQVDSLREEAQRNQRLREDEVRPKLSIDGTGGTFFSGMCSYSISIVNTGFVATEVLATLRIEGRAEVQHSRIAILDRGSTIPLTFQLPEPLPEEQSLLTISCTDALTQRHKFSFALFGNSVDPSIYSVVALGST